MARPLTSLIGIAAVAVAAWHLAPVVSSRQASPGYDALVILYNDMRASQRPVTGPDGVPDYRDATMQVSRARLDELGRRLDAFDSRTWPRAQRVDHLLVLAQWRNYDFEHRVMRPWKRDPGFYVDQLQRLPLTDTPIPASQIAAFRRQLAAVSTITAQAKANLTEGASEHTKAAIRNMEQADGVGHGFPYRAVPPAGVIGWYDDLIGRLGTAHPDLVASAQTARAEAVAFRDWLKQNESRMNRPSGMGLDNYDYYQRFVRLMPYTSDDNLLLGQRELERGRAFLAIERWKNRTLPPLDPSPNREDYERRKQDADQDIRRFIVEHEILTIPDYVKELKTNVPWIERPGGVRNFWEEIQFRDPRPDHVHAVIPGHGFDALVHRQDKRPIRGSFSDGGRTEGWAFYLEEMFLQAGLLDTRPRTKELYYLFQVKRATRTRAEVMMHANTFTVADAVRSMRENVEFLDDDVARVDAEIYLRRPAYGSGYQMGKLQIDQLLSDRYQQLRNAFNLKQFHDEFLAAGTIPIALIRFEMVGDESQLGAFWKRVPDTVASGR